MFFSHTILTKKGGKFAIIWLAATKAKKLKRREIESVDVEKTCNDIMKYLPQAGDVRRMRSKARFSLYLSSQLMYGTIVVWHQQHKYLLDDLKQIIDHIKKLFSVGSMIDMERPIGRNIDMVDPVLAFDPAFFENFGRANFSLSMSPSIMNFDDREYFEVHTARSSLEEEQPRHVAPAAAITLQEDDWLMTPYLEEGEEFPIIEDLPTEAAVQEIDALINNEFVPPASSPILRQGYDADIGEGPLATSEHLVVGAQPAEETQFIAPMMPPPVAPRRVPPEEPEVTPREPRQRAPRRQPPVAFELSPIDQVLAERPTPRRRAGARLRLIVDRANIISGEEMNRQIENLEGNNRTRDEIFVNPKKAQRATENWLESPGIRLGAGIGYLFEINLISRHEPGEFGDIFHTRPFFFDDATRSPTPKKSLSEIREEEQVQELPPPGLEPMEPAAAVAEPEASDAEIRRAQEQLKRTMESLGRPQMESGADTITPAQVTIDQLAEEQQQQYLEETRRPEEEEESAPKRPRVRSPAPVDHLAKCFPMPADMPNYGAPQTFALQMEQLENHVYEMTSGGRAITFDELCPTSTTTKAQAAKTFYMMLDMCRSRKVTIDQEEAFGPMEIKRPTKQGFTLM